MNSFFDAMMKKWADWKNDPPKSPWDVQRRSVLCEIEFAEHYLAHLHSVMGSFPANKPPDFHQTLAMLEVAREAARHAANIDPQLLIQVERATPSNG